MSKEEGVQVARTEVTQFIIKYIKDNNLQNPENRKMIMPDDTLKKLLAVKENDNVTYFNLQVYESSFRIIQMNNYVRFNYTYMPGRQQIPSFQLPSRTTGERDNSYNLTSVGSIFYTRRLSVLSLGVKQVGNLQMAMMGL